MKTPEEENPPPILEDHQPIVESLEPFKSFQEARASQAYRQHERTLDGLFKEPRIYETAAATPRLQAFLRVVVWNIERGTQLEGIIEALNHHPILRYADLLLLNELDIGMLRSGNLDVAQQLSRALSAHAIYGAEYLEFTKGTGEELQLEGRNTTALHGNAILTRHRFASAQLVRLPRCENNFESPEKRLGGRLATLVDLEIDGLKLLATTAHLDVVNTPRCRAKQLRKALEAVETRLQDQAVSKALSQVSQIASRADGSAKIILGGDFNTHTFARGGQFRTLINTIKILGSDRQRLARSLMKREPAIELLEQFHYEIDALNDGLPTSSSLVSALDDKSSLPAPVRWWVTRRVGPEGIRLEFRLDWLAARGLRALRAGEVIDRQTGVASIKAQTIKNLQHGGIRLSDHDPIVADFALR
jgi:endonuclease/exonuclease/phosphatase family metal-dependent hydrolase